MNIKCPSFDKTKVVVYVVGSISNDKDYKKKFDRSYSELTAIGYSRVIIPTCVINNLPYERYAPISIGFVQACDVVYALKDYKNSKGAKAEIAYAEMSGKVIIYEGEK